MEKFTQSEIESNNRNMLQKIEDDKDFLNSYGSLRTGVPSKAYKDGWDRIFGSADRDVNPVEVNSSDEPNLMEKQ